MQILVLNGSPKGEYSITLQTVRYLEKLYPEHVFDVLHVGSRIHSLEQDFTKAKEALAKAELILFCYPVYTFIVPCQLHRFIELMKASGVDLSGKFTTQLSTSKHFYDVTAHAFIEENSKDMHMKYIKGLSADMDDLLSDKGRKEAENFFEYVLWCIREDMYESIPEKKANYLGKTVTPLNGETKERKQGDIVIVADLQENDTQLSAMIKRFRSRCTRRTRVVNIREFPFKGGCISCFNCAVDGKCIYKDGFDTFLRDEIQTAEAIVIAFTVQDHSMGSRFKMYDDRQFCNGHRTVTMGMSFGYLISGPYAEEPNLQMIIHGRAEVGNNFLAGIATDEVDPDREIDLLAKRMEYAIEHHYVQPSNFLGVGGMKVFRDLIWMMQGLMKADHKFYKAHGQYDFPQKHYGKMLAMYLVGALMSNKKLMQKAGNNVKEGMIAPYRKALRTAEKKKERNT